MGKSIKDRAKARFENRGKSSNRIQAMNFDKDTTFWKPVKNKNHISILPFTITSKNNMVVRSRDAEVGDEDYVLELWVHRFVGDAKADLLCPKKHLGKPCPICEQKDIYMERGMKTEAGKCNPSQRAYYNIVNENDREKGVMIFQESWKNFQDELSNDAGDTDDGELVDYWDFKNGNSIKFRAEEKTFNKNKYFEYRSFKFIKREDPLPKSLKDSIINLDECMVFKSYDEIKALFYGEDVDVDDVNKDEEEEEEEEDTPKSHKKASKKVEEEEEEEEEEDDDDEDEDEVEEEEEEEEKPKKSSKKAKKVEEDEDEDEKPKKGKKKSEEVSDDDVPFEEDSTLEAAKKAGKKDSAKSSECPHGHVFGKDTDKFDECDDCKKYESCYKAKRASKGK